MAEVPASRRGWIGVGAVAAAAALLLAVVPGIVGGDGEIGLRGAEGQVPATLDLVVRRDGAEASERFDPTRVYDRGDTVYFVVSSDQSADLRLWATGPEGTSELGVERTGPSRSTFGGDTAVWYRLDRSGTYTFFAATDPNATEDRCDPPACVQREVDVR